MLIDTRGQSMVAMVGRRAIVAAGFAVISAGAFASSEVATYRLQQSLAADQGSAPALTAVNGGSFVVDPNVLGQSRTVYSRFTSNGATSSAQSALRLDTSSLGLTANNYAVEIVFTFTDTFDPRAANYRRVVDSFDPSSLQDPGFYVGPPGNELNIYQGGPHAGGPSLVDGTYYDVVLSVSPTGERAFLNGSLATSYSGTPDAIVSHYLTFFQDETFEYGNGKVALIRVFDGGLSDAQVLALNNGGNPFPAAIPEPQTVSLFGAGIIFLAGFFGARRRRSTIS